MDMPLEGRNKVAKMAEQGLTFSELIADRTLL